MRHDDAWRTQRFYRDPQHGKLMGVCAGMADSFGWNVSLIRVLMIMALLGFHALALIAYVVLGFVLPTKPDIRYDGYTHESYRRNTRHSAGDTLHEPHDRFHELDVKLQHMEGYVTSSRYDLDRQFRDLEH
jgi:phage shock protein C